MRERAIRFASAGRCFGILRSTSGACTGVLLLNAGLTYRVGPHRLYVRMARALAARGVPSLRFDFSGTGDSGPARDGRSFSSRALEEARAALSVLIRATGVARVVPIGMCTGADVALELCREDARAVGPVAINPGDFGKGGDRPDGGGSDEDELFEEAQARMTARYYRGSLAEPRRWIRLLIGKSNHRAIRSSLSRVLLHAERRPAARGLSSRKVQPGRQPRARTLLLVSEGSVSWDLLEIRYGAAATRNDIPGVMVERVRSCDHTFTPRWAQERLIEVAVSWTLHVDAGGIDRPLATPAGQSAEPRQ